MPKTVWQLHPLSHLDRRALVINDADLTARGVDQPVSEGCHEVPGFRYCQRPRTVRLL